jgi:hypothetical protein
LVVVLLLLVLMLVVLVVLVLRRGGGGLVVVVVDNGKSVVVGCEGHWVVGRCVHGGCADGAGVGRGELLLLLVVLRLCRVQHQDALDLAAFAAALDALVGEVVHVGEVLGHFLFFF